MLVTRGTRIQSKLLLVVPGLRRRRNEPRQSVARSLLIYCIYSFLAFSNLLKDQKFSRFRLAVSSLPRCPSSWQSWCAVLDPAPVSPVRTHGEEV